MSWIDQYTEEINKLLPKGKIVVNMGNIMSIDITHDEGNGTIRTLNDKKLDEREAIFYLAGMYEALRICKKS